MNTATTVVRVVAEGSSWSWLAAPVVGVAGIGGTVWAAINGRNATDRARRDEHVHQEAMAREARIQERRADAYVEALRLMHMVGEWAQRLRPAIEVEPMPPMPLPSQEEQVQVWSLIDVHGSSSCKELFERWQQAANAIRLADRKIGLSIATSQQHGASGINLMEVWGDLEDKLRPAESEARKVFASAAHEELNG